MLSLRSLALFIGGNNMGLKQPKYGKLYPGIGELEKFKTYPLCMTMPGASGETEDGKKFDILGIIPVGLLVRVADTGREFRIGPHDLMGLAAKAGIFSTEPIEELPKGLELK